MTRLLLTVMAVLSVAACSGDRSRGPDRPVDLSALPMPSDSAITAALDNFYGFMSIQWSTGDTLAFASNYADTTDLWVAGVGAHWNRAAIIAGFGQLGVTLRATGLRRESAGHATDGRIVTDSGAYEIEGATARRAGLDARGWYWTRWEYNENGQWRIVSDELLGATHQPSERAARPSRPTT